MTILHVFSHAWLVISTRSSFLCSLKKGPSLQPDVSFDMTETSSECVANCVGCKFAHIFSPFDSTYFLFLKANLMWLRKTMFCTVRTESTEWNAVAPSSWVLFLRSNPRPHVSKDSGSDYARSAVQVLRGFDRIDFTSDSCRSWPKPWVYRLRYCLAWTVSWSQWFFESVFVHKPLSCVTSTIKHCWLNCVKWHPSTGDGLK